jgi:hypothetical protein
LRPPFAGRLLAADRVLAGRFVTAERFFALLVEAFAAFTGAFVFLAELRAAR